MSNDLKLLRLRDALRLLPGLKPNSAQALIKSWEDDLLGQLLTPGGDVVDVKPVEVAGERLTLDSLNELIHDDDYAAPKISPRGAQILLRLYAAGALPMKGVSGRVDPALRAYAADGRDFRALREAENLRLQVELEAREALLSNPSAIPVGLFTEELINDVFFRHGKNGVGVTTMLVGGVEVTRTVMRYKSNSGKTQGYEVRLQWIGSDGVAVIHERRTPFADNRRNDANRNWGLPE